MTLLATWLTELHLDKLTQIKESHSEALSHNQKQEIYEYERGLHEEFCSFLSDYAHVLFQFLIIFKPSLIL